MLSSGDDKGKEKEEEEEESMSPFQEDISLGEETQESGWESEYRFTEEDEEVREAVKNRTSIWLQRKK